MSERERSKFRGILDVAKGRAPSPAEPLDDPPSITARPSTPTPSAVVASPPTIATPPPAPPAEALAPRGPGRPRGKRSDPAFDQVTAYIPHAMYNRVRLALLEDDKGQEFSELVADLLADWLTRRHRD